jgi:hypothetical protein
MKYVQQLSIFSLLFSLLFLFGCADDESPKKPCLPTQFPIEGEDGTITAIYDTKNILRSLTYQYEGDDDIFQSIRAYNGKEQIIQINFYVNGFLAQDFAKVSYANDTIKEEYYRGTSAIENLQSYRLYYLDDDSRVISFTEHDLADDFVRGDSIEYTYTADNISHIRVYDSFDVAYANYELLFDDKVNPYYKIQFNGNEYIYGFLNLSKNNPTSVTHIEAVETITYTYTYANNGFPLTRQSSEAVAVGDFEYSCSVE